MLFCRCSRELLSNDPLFFLRQNRLLLVGMLFLRADWTLTLVSWCAVVGRARSRFRRSHGKAEQAENVDLDDNDCAVGVLDQVLARRASEEALHSAERSAADDNH